MSYPLPPIMKLAERLLREIEQAVRQFARYHKYTLGTDLRAQAMQVVRVCHRAWRDRRRQAYWVDQLVWAIDEVKLSLQLGSQLHAFRSFRQAVGQCGARLRFADRQPEFPAIRQHLPRPPGSVRWQTPERQT